MDALAVRLVLFAVTTMISFQVSRLCVPNNSSFIFTRPQNSQADFSKLTGSLRSSQVLSFISGNLETLI